MSHAGNRTIEQYAEALLLLAEAAGRVPSVEAGLKSISTAIQSSTEILRFLSDSFVTSEGKQEALGEIFGGHIDPLLTSFLKILQFEGRIDVVGPISKHFSTSAAARLNRVSGEVISAIELPKDRIAAIEKQVSLVLNMDVSLDHVQDTDMLGGILVKVGDFVIDGTVDTELLKARSSLAG